MSFSLEYRFVKILLTFAGNDARFEISSPWAGTYGSLDEVRGAIDAQFDN